MTPDEKTAYSFYEYEPRKIDLLRNDLNCTSTPWLYEDDGQIGDIWSSGTPYRDPDICIAKEVKPKYKPLIAAAPYLYYILAEAVFWDGYDEEGEPAVWLDEANELLAQIRGEQV